MTKIFKRDNHTVYHNDCLYAISNYIPDKSIDLIFLDPPYNIGKKFSNFSDNWDNEQDYINWIYLILSECNRVLKPNGSLYLMTGTQYMPYFDLYVRQYFTILSRIIWSYDSSGVQAKKYFGSMYEPILYCVKDKNNYTFNSQDIMVEAKTGSQRQLIDYRKDPPQLYNTQKVPGNVWDFTRVRYKMGEYENHPTQKPESLLNRIILASSNEGNTVLDPFSGTFTTAAVCKKLYRNSISIESQDEYINIGLKRVFENKFELV